VVGVRAGLLLSALCLIVVSACGGSGDDAVPSAVPKPAVSFGELTVDGHARTYRVFTPPTVNSEEPVPLVLALHDAYGDAEAFKEITGFDAAATAGNFVVVYPDSLEVAWNGGFCCGRAAADEIADLAFLDGVLDEVMSEGAIDPARVYAVGASSGAIMAYRMACESSDRLAGVAAVGGATVMDDCAPSRPVSILAIHGTKDGQVPYDGGLTSGGPIPVPPQSQLLGRWAELDGCDDEVDTTEAVLDTATWSGCAEGTSVQLITVVGGGHTWFADELGDVSGAVDATAAITEFFELTPP
jgi:polyhydroxybutyrate depolymerase